MPAHDSSEKKDVLVENVGRIQIADDEHLGSVSNHWSASTMVRRMPSSLVGDQTIGGTAKSALTEQ